MSAGTPREPGGRAFRFSRSGPVLASVTTANGTVEIRNSTGSEAVIEVVPKAGSSVAGETEAAALLADWMRQDHEVTEADVLGGARPEYRFDVPMDVALAHPMRVRLWLPVDSQYSVGTETATVSAEGTFDPSRVSSDRWNADIGLEGTDQVTICWEQMHIPTRTVLRVEGASGSVTVDRSGCEVAVKIDGPVAVRNVTGDVVVFNYNGDTRVEGIDGSVSAHSRRGDLTAMDVTHHLSFWTVSGTRAILGEIGTLGEYDRKADSWKPLPAKPSAQAGLTALAVARSVVDSAAAQVGDPTGDTFELPPGKKGDGPVILRVSGPPPGRDEPKR